MNIFPIPTGTPVLEANNQPTMAWSRYLKALGDWLLQANKVVLAGPLTYVQQGTILYVTAQGGVVGAAVDLPYAARLPFTYGATLYPAGTKSITVAAGTTVQFWFVRA